MKLLKSLLCVLAGALLVTACGGDTDQFVIRLRLSGIGSQGVEMVYTDAQGRLKRVTAHPDAKEILQFSGVAPQPTFVELFTTGRGEPVAAFPIRNGEKIEARMTLGQPGSLEMKGPKSARQYIEMLAEADSFAIGEERNRVVARLVTAHPDRVASAFLLMTAFDVAGHELEADSLVNLLRPETRPQGMFRNWAQMLGAQLSTGASKELRTVSLPFSADSLKRAQVVPAFQPYSLLAVTNRPKDSRLKGELRSLRDSFPDSRLGMLEACVEPDSATWRADIRRDTASWHQGWAPGGVAQPQLRRLNIPRVPYFIAADSTGSIIYRGESIDEAAELLRTRLAGSQAK